MAKSRKSPKKAAGLAEIAATLGLSRMAVSLALRNQPGVGPATRTRVLAAAKKLGYVPDARMAEWMAQVRSTKKQDLLPIAWINTDEEPNIWQKYPFFTPYWEGASTRARELGYRLDEFWLHEPGMSEARLSQILFQRGIEGVLVAPPKRLSIGRLRLKWDHFAGVTFEKAIWAPHLHVVLRDHHYNLMLALKLLRRFGYRRIGVCVGEQTNRRSRYLYPATLGHFHSSIPKEERIPWFIHRYKPESDIQFEAWMRRWKPDVVVGQNREMVEWVERLGRKVPEEIGVVHLAIEDDCIDWAGIFSRKREIGALSIEILVSLLRARQKGIPAFAAETLVPGTWRNGKTLLVPKPGRS